jgi:hypothetical protein
VNVGTALKSPSPPSGGGQARRRLLASGRDGVLVVVGARESRAHGEGGQPDSESGSVWQKSTVNTVEPTRALSTSGVLRGRPLEHRFDGSGGEPGAVRVARRVRRAGQGNGPAERLAPRPGSTQQRPPSPPGPPAATAGPTIDAPRNAAGLPRPDRPTRRARRTHPRIRPGRLTWAHFWHPTGSARGRLRYSHSLGQAAVRRAAAQ